MREVIRCPRPGCDGIADAEVHYVQANGGEMLGPLVDRILGCRKCGYPKVKALGANA
jgi:hypothetical protein